MAPKYPENAAEIGIQGEKKGFVDLLNVYQSIFFRSSVGKQARKHGRCSNFLMRSSVGKCEIFGIWWAVLCQNKCIKLN